MTDDAPERLYLSSTCKGYSFERESVHDIEYQRVHQQSDGEPWADVGGHVWELRPNTTCVECPHCCFIFAAFHTSQVKDGEDNYEGYDCPNCDGCPEAARAHAPVVDDERVREIRERINLYANRPDLGELSDTTMRWVGDTVYLLALLDKKED